MSAGLSTATVVTARPATRRPARDQVVVIPHVGWKGYVTMLRLLGDRGRPRMLYLEGDVHLMAPGHSHERDKERFGMFVVEVARGVRLPFRAAGSTTYRRRKKDAGVEPDQSYYLSNAGRVRNKKRIDLRVDPPPDLSIEVVYHHSASEAIEVSRRLGIPEVWVRTEKGLDFLRLAPDGSYAQADTSLAFPFLKPDEVLDWISRPEGEEESDLEWSDDLAAWVRDTLLPRVRDAVE